MCNTIVSLKKIMRTGALFFLLCLSGCGVETLQAPDSAHTCFVDSGYRFSEALGCYRQAHAAQVLDYVSKGRTQVSDVEKRSFYLSSQNWSPEDLVEPAIWRHDVDIYIPDDALKGRALLVVNNGINITTVPNGTKPASDLNETMLINIAKQTKTIVVSVSNVPNQFLVYTDDGVARREDSSVAHSWQLFMQSPQTRPFMSVPMMEAVVKTMDLAEIELKRWKIDSFIVTGASKRAWAAWLATIADRRIDAIAPFVIDVLNMGKVIEHTYQSYGKHWPLAFGDYEREGVIAHRESASYDKLLQIEDPLRYLQSAHAHRLDIPKYIVNASGDDFFVPDNTRFYFDTLPGVKALRVAPNASHFGVIPYIQSSLITFVNRLQRDTALPMMHLKKTPGKWHIDFSETPVKLTLWSASNTLARDFRFACGVRYGATPLTASKNLSVNIATPEQGWQASFVEAQFADGFVITTPVEILPDTYPDKAPPESGPACKTRHALTTRGKKNRERHKLVAPDSILAEVISQVFARKSPKIWLALH